MVYNSHPDQWVDSGTGLNPVSLSVAQRDSLRSLDNKALHQSVVGVRILKLRFTTTLGELDRYPAQSIMAHTVSDIRAFLSRVEDANTPSNARTQLSQSQIEELRANYPSIPNEYLEYLSLIGWGTLRESTYMMYSGLVHADEILQCIEGEQEILCFGDDMTGDPAGFIPSQNWKLIEIFHENNEVHDPEQTFLEFIAERLYLGKDGDDLSIQPS